MTYASCSIKFRGFDAAGIVWPRECPPLKRSPLVLVATADTW